MALEVVELRPAECALVEQPSILGHDKHGTRNRMLDRGADERVRRRNPVREAGVGASDLSKERKGEKRGHAALGRDFNQLRAPERLSRAHSQICGRRFFDAAKSKAEGVTDSTDLANSTDRSSLGSVPCPTNPRRSLTTAHPSGSFGRLSA